MYLEVPQFYKYSITLLFVISLALQISLGLRQFSFQSLPSVM